MMLYAIKQRLILLLWLSISSVYTFSSNPNKVDYYPFASALLVKKNTPTTTTPCVAQYLGVNQFITVGACLQLLGQEDLQIVTPLQADNMEVCQLSHGAYNAECSRYDITFPAQPMGDGDIVVGFVGKNKISKKYIEDIPDERRACYNLIVQSDRRYTKPLFNLNVFSQLSTPDYSTTFLLRRPDQSLAFESLGLVQPDSIRDTTQRPVSWQVNIRHSV